MNRIKKYQMLIIIMTVSAIYTVFQQLNTAISPDMFSASELDATTIEEGKQHALDESLDILDRNGLTLHIEIMLRYKPMPEKIPFLTKEYGNIYAAKLISPEARSAVRHILGNYTAEEIYATKRHDIEEEIVQSVRNRLDLNNIIMTAFYVKSLRLPEQIQEAIELKHEYKQEALAYSYKLEKEKQETKRVRMVTEREAEMNEIIAKTLTPELVRLKGVESILSLAQSQNTKIIIITDVEGNLPFVIEGGDIVYSDGKNKIKNK